MKRRVHISGVYVDLWMCQPQITSDSALHSACSCFFFLTRTAQPLPEVRRFTMATTALRRQHTVAGPRQSVHVCASFIVSCSSCYDSPNAISGSDWIFLFRRRLSMHRTSILEELKEHSRFLAAGSQGPREGHDSAFAFLFSPWRGLAIIITTILIPAFLGLFLSPYQFVITLTCLMSFLLCLYLLLGIIITPHVSLARWEGEREFHHQSRRSLMHLHPLGASDIWGLCSFQRVPFLSDGLAEHFVVGASGESRSRHSHPSYRRGRGHRTRLPARAITGPRPRPREPPLPAEGPPSSTSGKAGGRRAANCQQKKTKIETKKKSGVPSSQTI